MRMEEGQSDFTSISIKLEHTSYPPVFIVLTLHKPETRSTGKSLSCGVTLSSLEMIQDEKTLVFTLSFELGTNK